MKVLFANPAYRIDIDKKYEQYFFCAGSRCPWSLVKAKKQFPRYSMFPFFMGYSAAILEKAGYEVEAIDAVPLNMTLNEFLLEAENSNPDVILFEPATTSFKWTIKIADHLKKKTGALIILAGSHVSVFAKETLESHTSIDFVLIGEYELGLIDLINSINNNGCISTIDGIAYRKGNGEIIVNSKTHYVDLNALPMPARHLFPSKKKQGMHFYHDGFCQNRPSVQLHSSRGCPFNCSFCLWTQVMYKPYTYRVLDSARVVDEMILVREQYNAREVYFDDDTFSGNKDHVMQICNEIINRRLSIPWSAMCDAMILDKEMLVTMKRAGCIGIKLGLESAVPEILKRINKPLNLKKLEDIIRTSIELKIKTHVSVSFGHIGETMHTIKQTMRYVLKLDSDSIQFSIATPYPGTRFFDNVSKIHKIKIARWEEFDPTHNSVFDLPGLPFEFLKKTESKAHGYWLRRKLIKPKWFLRQTNFMFYILKEQGISGLKLRLFRAADILFRSVFK